MVLEVAVSALLEVGIVALWVRSMEHDADGAALSEVALGAGLPQAPAAQAPHWRGRQVRCLWPWLLGCLVVSVALAFLASYHAGGAGPVLARLGAAAALYVAMSFAVLKFIAPWLRSYVRVEDFDFLVAEACGEEPSM